MDLESVGSTDPMPVDSDTASLDTFATDVMIYNDPLPQADGCDAMTTEVMIISHGDASDESAHDAPHAAVHDLTIPPPGRCRCRSTGGSPPRPPRGGPEVGFHEMPH